MDRLRSQRASFRTRVALYTILDVVKNAPTPHHYHPIAAAFFSTAVILGAVFSPSLAIIMSVTCVAIVVTYLLIDSKKDRITFAWIVALCVIFSLARLALIAITTTSESSSFTLPQFTFPSWLGSLELGGAVDTQVITTSATSMALLTAVIVGCCAFSFLIGPHRIIHLIPRQMRSFRESTLIASNVLWRAPNEVRLINEAQYNHPSTKFSVVRFVFPAFVSELVNQSTTHAGVADLRKSALSQRVRWYRFSFIRRDADLIGLTFSLTAVFLAMLALVS